MHEPTTNLRIFAAWPSGKCSQRQPLPRRQSTPSLLSTMFAEKVHSPLSMTIGCLPLFSFILIKRPKEKDEGFIKIPFRHNYQSTLNNKTHFKPLKYLSEEKQG